MTDPSWTAPPRWYLWDGGFLLIASLAQQPAKRLITETDLSASAG